MTRRPIAVAVAALAVASCGTSVRSSADNTTTSGSPEPSIGAPAPETTSDPATPPAVSTTVVAPSSTTSPVPPPASSMPADPPGPERSSGPGVIAALDDRGDAVLVPADGAAPLRLVDGPDPDATGSDAYRNVVDSIAVSTRAGTVYVGLCCEPANGLVLRGTPADVPVDQPTPIPGYAPAFSPDGRLLATGQIFGPVVSIRDVIAGVDLIVPEPEDPDSAYTPYDTVWLDDGHLAAIGISVGSGSPTWVAIPIRVDGDAVAVGSPIDLGEELGVDEFDLVRAAGSDDDRFGVHVPGASAGRMVAFRLDGVADITDGLDVGGPARSIWYRGGSEATWVDDAGAIRDGDRVVSDLGYAWARPTGLTELDVDAAPIPIASAIDIDARTLFGLEPSDRTGVDAAIVRLGALGAPNFDTGWQEMPERWRCTQRSEYRTIWWGDLRLTFERDPDHVDLTTWSVGDPAAAFGPLGAIPPARDPSGVMSGGIGVGDTRADLLASLAGRDLVIEEAGTITLGGALGFTYLLDGDVVTGVGLGRLDCLDGDL